MKKVSFDFDGCLGDRGDVQDYCEELLARPGVEVWIVTSRPERPEEFFTDWNKLSDDSKWSNDNDLFPLAERLGIPRERIVFTWWKDKVEWFREHGEGFVFHLDDNDKELRELRSVGHIMGVCCYGSGNWRSKCERALGRVDV